MKPLNESRRDFLKKAIVGKRGFLLVGVLPNFSAKGYGKIIGTNEIVRVGIMGVNSRGLALASTFAVQPKCEIISISDVDTRAKEKCITTLESLQKAKPKAQADFRKALEDKAQTKIILEKNSYVLFVSASSILTPFAFFVSLS